MPDRQETGRQCQGSVVFRKPIPGEVPHYELPDDQLVHGASLSNRRIWVNTRFNGTIERVFYNDLGMDLLGSVSLTYTVPKKVLISPAPVPRCLIEQSGGHYRLMPEGSGTITIYPFRQKHAFDLSGNLHVEETTQVPRSEVADPPVVMQLIQVTNQSQEKAAVVMTAHIDIAGDSQDDLVTRFDEDLNALVVYSQTHPDHCRLIGFDRPDVTCEITQDAADSYAVFTSEADAGNQGQQNGRVAQFHVLLEMEPGETAEAMLRMAVSHLGEQEARTWFDQCQDFRGYTRETIALLRPVVSLSSVETPDPIINQGVFWSKVNMLAVMADYPEGPAFTNEPGLSSNVVGRDVAWFVYGADYLVPAFSGQLLAKFAEKQYENGKIPEYYDALDGRVEDYGLSMNDDTPLFVLACAHQCAATHDPDFLGRIYPSAKRAAEYILSQRDEQGLVVARADGQEVWGIASWRNVIPNYQINGAVTEINSECYAALREMGHLSQSVGDDHAAHQFFEAAEDLKACINSHLINPNTGLYYLNIDASGTPRTDVTADEVFPVLFGVAPPDTATRIIGRLRAEDFMTSAGLRTVSRNSPEYEPTKLIGLKGGVWPGVAFWYAFAAAKVNPEFMVEALHSSYLQYLLDPLKNNTVPGQFAEWFDGESLVNRGMRLSPWEPPRLLWAAVEGLCGAKAKPDGSYVVAPKRPRNWKWTALRRLPCSAGFLTFFATFEEEAVHIYSNMHVDTPHKLVVAGRDVSNKVRLADYRVLRTAFATDEEITICLGTEAGAYVTASVALCGLMEPDEHYALGVYSSASGWVEAGVASGEVLSDIAITIEDGEFRVLKITKLQR